MCNDMNSQWLFQAGALDLDWNSFFTLALLNNDYYVYYKSFVFLFFLVGKLYIEKLEFINFFFLYNYYW